MNRKTAILQAVGLAAEYLGKARWHEHVDLILERLATATEVSRIYVFENRVHEDGSVLTSQRYEWVAPGITPQRDNLELQDFSFRARGFGRWLELLSRGEVVQGLVSDMPPSERSLLQDQEIFSIVVVPVFLGNDWWGFIGFDDCSQNRAWSSAEVEALKAAGNLFGAAIQHRRLQQLEQRLSKLATHDELTLLLNRRGMREVLDQNHARTLRSGHRYCLALIDMDRFKITNDAYGHTAGDEVLAGVASTMRKDLRPADAMGRWGGEEFLCFLPDTSIQDAVSAMERLRRQVAELIIQVDGHAIKTSISVGVAAYLATDETWETVFARADAALYVAKRDGRDRIVGAQGPLTRAPTMASKLEFALRHQQLKAAYQPIVDLRNRQPVAEETLARILDPDGNCIEAGAFVDVASRIQLLHGVDEAMMRATLNRCSEHFLAGRNLDHFVNVSADLLRHPNLLKELFDHARGTCDVCTSQVASEKPIVIEITEHELVRDIPKVRNMLAPFLEMGMRLAIDDFGSGYSSFQYLVHLPAAFLKIDGELVQLVESNPRARAIVRSIQRTAMDLGLRTIAERVETADTADILEEMDVDWAQGFYFGSPILE